VSINIRNFIFEKDLVPCRNIWEHAGEGVHLSKSDEPAEILKKLERDPDLFLVAEDESGEVIGTVIGGFDGRRGMMYHLAVVPQHRNKGVASLLVKELEARLRQKGCTRSYLLVLPSNQTAIDFYEKRHWNRLDLYIYGKDLTDDD
jgi:ribosomal protein S18 acetylase RimI-like enzyme